MHDTESGSVLTVADAELLGKTLKEGVVSFTVSKRFYHEKLVSEKELEPLLNGATNINLIGSISIGIAKKKGLVGESGVRRISGIPHAQVYKVNL